MGRYKRKQDYYKQNKISSIDSEGKPKHRNEGGAFSPLDLDRVKEYLTNYRDSCFRVWVNGGAIIRSDNGIDTSSDVQTMGGIDFPVLTPEVLSQPYLALPSALTPKFRRSIHMLCIQLDLFHESLGPSGETRYIVISIYRDGFDHLRFENRPTNGDKQPNSTVTIPVRECRPWFCRRDKSNSMNGDAATMIGSPSSNVEQATKRGRKQIETLMDHPGDCLRDGDSIDALDFSEMDGEDLSTIESPSASDRDGDHWMMVDSTDKMRQCAQELLTSDAAITELAFDLEFYNPSKYLQVTCLLQLSSNAGKDYVIDTLADGVWDHVALLRPLFADPKVVKIGHSISGDVQSLHRDFGIFVVNAFDTYEAVKVLEFPRKGLANVCGRYGLQNSEEYVRLKGLYQSTDWRRRPLTEPMVRYGRYDVHYLVKLRRLLIRDLVKDNLWTNVEAKQESQRVAQALAATLSTIAAAEGDVDESDFFMNCEEDYDLPESNLSDDEDDDDDDGFHTPDGDDVKPRTKVGAKALRMQPDLMRVLSASQQRCLDLWGYKPESLAKNTQYADLMKLALSGEVEWANSHAVLLNDLIAWRTQVAIKEECLEGMVVNMDLLISVATKRPVNEAALRRIKYILPEILQNPTYINELLEIVRASLAKDDIQSAPNIPSYQDVSKQRRKSQNSSGILWLVVATTCAAIVGVAILQFRRRRR